MLKGLVQCGVFYSSIVTGGVGRLMWSRGANHGVMFLDEAKAWTDPTLTAARHGFFTLAVRGYEHRACSVSARPIHCPQAWTTPWLRALPLGQGVFAGIAHSRQHQKV